MEDPFNQQLATNLDPDNGEQLVKSHNNHFFLIQQNLGLSILTWLKLPLSNRGQHGGTKVNTLQAD